MTGEECKFLHPAPCRKHMKTPKEDADHNARATVQNSANILGPQGNVTTIGASEYISRAQGASKPHLRTQVPSTTPRTTNQQQSMIATQNLDYNRPPPLLTLPTQHDTTTHPGPPPTYCHTPPLHNISPLISLPFHCTIIPYHSMQSLIQRSHPQLLLNPFIRL